MDNSSDPKISKVQDGSTLDLISESQKNENQAMEWVQQTFAAKISAMAEMSGFMAHEVNNPLAVIVGRISLMRRKLSLGQLTPEEIVSGLDKIEAGTTKITEILKSSRRTLGTIAEETPQYYSLQNLFSYVQEMLFMKLKNNYVDLKFEAEENLKLKFQSGQMAQALYQLLANSFDALQEVEEKSITVTAKTVGESIEIAIQDNGKGIAPELASQLMKPFFTTKSELKGAGTGLKMAALLVKNNGGILKLDTQSQQTRFVLSFPKSLSVPEAKKPNAA